jgi:hypothetical protein
VLGRISKKLNHKEFRGIQMSAMHRKMIWIEDRNFQGWACSECAWAYKPLGPLVGESIDEMKVHYESERDKEFASHVCAAHPRPTKNRR